MPVLITAAALRRFAINCDYLALAPALDRECRAFEIDTPRRVRHFMAHMHVESGGFTQLEEDLNYTARRLCKVWPKRFPDLATAEYFAHRPATLAEKVYGKRMGNVQAGWGWRFRGRGFTQLTGHDNYARASLWSGLDLVKNPDLAAQLGPAARIAAAFWHAEGCNQIVDADPGETSLGDIANRIRANEEDDLAQATREINNGETGLDLRRAQLLRAGPIWPD